MSKNGSVKIETTKQYEQFKFLPGNRALDEKHVLKLMASMFTEIWRIFGNEQKRDNLWQ